MNNLQLKLLSLAATMLYVYIVYALTFRAGEPIIFKPFRREADMTESLILTSVSFVTFLVILKYNHDTAFYLK